MGTSCRSRMYHFEGKLVSEDELVEKYAKDSGVTAAVFRKRVRTHHWDIEHALTTPPTEEEEKPTYQSSDAESKQIKVMFTHYIEGVFARMQPKLFKVYDAKFVKLSAAKRSNANAVSKNEFAIITLENGKRLIAYKGEYVEVDDANANDVI